MLHEVCMLYSLWAMAETLRLRWRAV
jgi:hypothetical protein